MKTYGNNTIELLDTSIDVFYSYQAKDVSSNKVIEFKAMFITLMNQLERVFNGVFGRVFKLVDEKDIGLFKELFPVMFDVATKNYGVDGLHKLCSILSTFRNMNAHAYCSCNYAKELDAKFILEQLPNKNPNVRYLDGNGIPTIGGMITLLFFLCNEKCIKLFIKNDVWEGFVENLNYFDDDYTPSLTDFPNKVMEVNRVNYEMEIRREKYTESLISAMFGRFAKDVYFKDGSYHYQNGDEFEDSSYHVSFTIEDKDQKTILAIKKNSNYHCYFYKDYILNIVDVEGFMDWCNKVPPFMFIVFLFRAKVLHYKKETLGDEIKNLAIKLNAPKFYVDKNVDTLFMSNNISDIRMGSQIISTGINYCITIFEFNIFKRNSLRVLKYSSFRQALEYIKIPEQTIQKMVAIRNFFAHYYLLGDYHIVGNSSAKITLDYILIAFDEFVKQLKDYDYYKAKNVYNDVFYRVICAVILFKYGDMMSKCNKFLRHQDDECFEAITKTNKRIKNSFVTYQVEDLIKTIYPDKHFSVFGADLLYIHKCIIKSKNGVTFKKGNTIAGDITLYTARIVEPQKYIINETCNLIHESIKGFVDEKVWEVE